MSMRLLLGWAGSMMLLTLAACATGAPRQSASAAAPGQAAPGAAAQAEPPPAGETAAQPAAASPEAPAAMGASAESTDPPSAASAASGSDKLLPPCVPVHRARPKHRKPKTAPEPQTPAGPPPPEPANAVVDAQVSEVGTALGSILGRDVMSPKGEDLGRVVDVLADARGHVRVAIIDFGGFLGVGTRRIAVDWPLLRFDLNARDKPLILSVDRQKLQSAPEYNPSKPRVLVPPAAPDAPDAGQAKK